MGRQVDRLVASIVELARDPKAAVEVMREAAAETARDLRWKSRSHTSAPHATGQVRARTRVGADFFLRRHVMPGCSRR